MEQTSAAGRPLASPRAPVPDLVGEVNRLYQEAGSPSYRQLEEFIERNDKALSRSTIGRMLNGKDNPRWSRWDILIRCLAKQSISIDHDVDFLIKRLYALYQGNSVPGNKLSEEAREAEKARAATSTAVRDAESEQAVAAAWRAAQDEIAFARSIAAAEQEVEGSSLEEEIEQRPEAADSADGQFNGLTSARLSFRVQLSLVLFLYSTCGLLAGGVVGALVANHALGNSVLGGAVAGITVGLFTGEVMAGIARHHGPEPFWHRTPGLTGLGGLVGLAAGTIVVGASATHLVDGLLLGCASGIGMGGLMGSVFLAGRALSGSLPVDGILRSEEQGSNSEPSRPRKSVEGKAQS